jgi:hypothetical protein
MYHAIAGQFVLENQPRACHEQASILGLDGDLPALDRWQMR